MEMLREIKILLMSLAILAALAAIPRLGAVAGIDPFIDFGGPVFAMTPCVDPPGAILLTLGPPSAFTSVAWMEGTFSYLYGPPSHLSQQVLGRALVPVVCMVKKSGDLVPEGTGYGIVFHGSSAK